LDLNIAFPQVIFVFFSLLGFLLLVRLLFVKFLSQLICKVIGFVLDAVLFILLIDVDIDVDVITLLGFSRVDAYVDHIVRRTILGTVFVFILFLIRI